MDKKKMQQVFRTIKKQANLDFAITNPDRFGDCQSCVWGGLCEKYGDDCTGIWAKEWNYGMNGGRGIENLKSVYIAHALTDEQAKIVMDILKDNYNIVNGEFDSGKCIVIEEK